MPKKKNEKIIHMYKRCNELYESITSQ